MTTNQNNQDQYIQGQFKTNLLKSALLKVAQAEHITLMSELITRDIDPFAVDIESHSIIIHSIKKDPVKTAAVILELAGVFNNFKKEGSNE